MHQKQPPANVATARSPTSSASSAARAGASHTLRQATSADTIRTRARGMARLLGKITGPAVRPSRACEVAARRASPATRTSRPARHPTTGDRARTATWPTRSMKRRNSTMQTSALIPEHAATSASCPQGWRAAGAGEIERFETAGEHDDRNREQERKARTGPAREAGGECRGHRDPGTRHARYQRERLRRADQQHVAPAQRAEFAASCAESIGEPQQHAEDHRGGGNDERRAQVAGDEVVADQAHQADRDRSEQHGPREPRLRIALALREGHAPAAAQGEDVMAKISAHGGQAAEVCATSKASPGRASRSPPGAG